MFEKSIDENISHIMEWISCKAIRSIQVYEESVVRLCDLFDKDGCMTYIFTVEANRSATYR